MFANYDPKTFPSLSLPKFLQRLELKENLPSFSKGDVVFFLGEIPGMTQYWAVVSSDGKIYPLIPSDSLKVFDPKD